MSDSELDDLLDDAAGALRDETRSPGVEDVTLARVQRSLSEREPLDDVLDEATEALRAETLEADMEGTLRRIEASLEDAAAALREQTEGEADVEATWDRIEASLTTTEDDAPVALPTRRISRAGWAAAAAAALVLLFGMPTAWAWSTGALPSILIQLDLMEPPAPEPPVGEETPTPTTRRRVRRAPPPVAPTPAPEPEPIEAVDPPAPPPAPRPTARAATPDPDPTPDPTPTPDPIPDADTLAFSTAHDVHFGGGAPAAALAAWDDYLSAYPHGRYEPEARYNRALSLARLGRLEAARDALQPFADGGFRGYRRTEAARLIEALDARIADE